MKALDGITELKCETCRWWDQNAYFENLKLRGRIGRDCLNTGYCHALPELNYTENDGYCSFWHTGKA